jgi:hypothetical protein
MIQFRLAVIAISVAALTVNAAPPTQAMNVITPGQFALCTADLALR